MQKLNFLTTNEFNQFLKDKTKELEEESDDSKRAIKKLKYQLQLMQWFKYGSGK
jgi:hypothetical protein